MINLNGKTAIVSGAARGIGRAVAEHLAACGARVFPLDIAELGADYPADLAADYLRGDITDSQFLKQSVLDVKRAAGGIDILVNNAALISYEPIEMVAKDTMKRMFDVNVLAVVELTQYVGRLMKRQGGGSIINMASIVGLRGQAGQAIYAASKGAVIALTYSLAKEFAGHGVRVNALAPGMVATERLKAEMAGRFDDRVADIGLQRMATPQDIANSCAFLAADEAAYITGQIIGLDGCLKI